MESILKAINKQKLPINPVLVISNNQDAKGLEIARLFGVKTVVIDSKDFKGKDRWEYDSKVVKVLKENGVTSRKGIICLAGFMRILSPQFVKKYKNRILNIHPALLPAFPGIHAQKQALEYGVKYTGCTVHFVDAGVDTGPIIIQTPVPVKDDDTEETLSKRILRKEHKIYPEAVKIIAQGRLRVSGRKTVIKDEKK